MYPSNTAIVKYLHRFKHLSNVKSHSLYSVQIYCYSDVSQKHGFLAVTKHIWRVWQCKVTPHIGLTQFVQNSPEFHWNAPELNAQWSLHTFTDSLSLNGVCTYQGVQKGGKTAALFCSVEAPEARKKKGKVVQIALSNQQLACSSLTKPKTVFRNHPSQHIINDYTVNATKHFSRRPPCLFFGHIR